MLRLRDKPKIMSLDYETFSFVDLTKANADVYARDTSTMALMAAWAFDRGRVGQWVGAEGEPRPAEFEDALVDPRIEKWAWNAPFEMNITKHVLGIPVNIRHWRDTMVQALHCSLPGKLEKAGEVIGLPMEMQKDRRGKALMRKFSMPYSPKRGGQKRHFLWHESLEEWNAYCAYNRSDVVAERNIHIRLEPYAMPDFEWEYWFLDQQINFAGIPINLSMVNNAIAVYEEALKRDQARLNEITGLANANSLPQLLPWLKDQGYMFDDCKKGHIQTARDYFDEPNSDWGDNWTAVYQANETLKEALDLRLQTSRTSIKKYYALQRATADDGRLRGTLQMNGAARTGREAGRVYQPQNLPRPNKEYEDFQPLLAQSIESMDLDDLELIYGSVYDVLASGLRPTAQAPEGHLFVDADLSAIENRVLGWLAGCDKILDVFRRNLDPYISFATYLYNAPYDVLWHEYKVENNGAKRTIAKPGTLGCPRGDTLVLTRRGWVRLDQVQLWDQVHDGVEWVSHEGVVDQGVQACVNMSGVVITGDHKVWHGGDKWLEAEAHDSHSWRKAIEAAVSRLSDTLKTDPLLARFISADAIAVARSNSDELALLHQIDRSEGASSALGGGAAQIATGSDTSFLTFSRTVFTRFAGDAQTRLAKVIGCMASAALSAVLRIPTRLSSIASMCLALTGLWRLTAKTMTGTTSPETCVSGIALFKTATVEIATRSSMVAAGILRQSFDACSRQDTGMTQPSLEKPGMDAQPKRSSPIKRDAGGHTVFDILNAGPRNRFVILSADGPCVIHNCGYGMGAGQKRVNRQTGEVEGTGLLGYAWNMGVKHFTEKDAQHSVDTFRREFSEVKDYWYDLERAAMRCVRTGGETRHQVPGGPEIRFVMDGPFLKMVLPSTRCLYYLRPRLELCDTPWGDKRKQLTYEGLNDRKQWVRQHTTPGKITENADQAISRDLLFHGMLLAKKRGIDVRLHVHDQIVGVSLASRADKDLQILIECMEESPWWADGLPLGSNGHASPVFIKD